MYVRARSLLLCCFVVIHPCLRAEDPSVAMYKTIDEAVVDLLAKSGAPSASIAVVKNGAIAYVKAYGNARLGPPPVAAVSGMPYSIGSVSKQFTAAAVLMLAEQGLLSLDDRVVRFLPELTRAKDVSIRQLLSMTSGYQDYWPQDYVMLAMLKPVTASEILAQWAKKPLDFEPGTRWQYSNTNYVIAGAIVERVTGRPLLELLRERIFGPLGMTSVVDTDQAPLGPGDPAGYVRFALGPLRAAPKEGKGWLFAAAELAMTAEDLARWDLAMIEQKVLRPDSWRTLETDVPLANGAPTQYGLGVGVRLLDGRRVISHGGEVSGFTARNDVYPDDKAAVVVLVNRDGSGAAGKIAGKIREKLFASAGDGSEEAGTQARRILDELQEGRIDRALFTPNANAYFSDVAVADFVSSLRPLGRLMELTQVSQSLRGGMAFRRFKVKYKKKELELTTRTVPDGKLEQFMLAPLD